MDETRLEKVKSLLREAAAEFIQNESNKTSFITVTDANVSSNLRDSTIFFTVYPEEKEAEAVDFLKRKRAPFREFAKKKLSFLRIMPRFQFEIDKGEKNRQRIEDISKKI